MQIKPIIFGIDSPQSDGEFSLICLHGVEGDPIGWEGSGIGSVFRRFRDWFIFRKIQGLVLVWGHRTIGEHIHIHVFLAIA
jgi:hypothetical protein